MTNFDKAPVSSPEDDYGYGEDDNEIGSHDSGSDAESSIVKMIEEIEGLEKQVGQYEEKLDSLMDMLDTLPPEKQKQFLEEIRVIRLDLAKDRKRVDELNEANENFFSLYDQHARGLRNQISLLESAGQMAKAKVKRQELDEVLQALNQMTGKRQYTEAERLAQVNAKYAKDVAESTPDNVYDFKAEAKTELMNDTQDQLIKIDQKALMDEMVQLGMERDNLREKGDEEGAFKAEALRKEKLAKLQKMWEEEDERENAAA